MATQTPEERRSPVAFGGALPTRPPPAHLLRASRYVRVLALAEYPRYVPPNWLGPLVDFDEPIDLSLHLEPLESAAAIRSLTPKLGELQSSRLLEGARG